MSRGIEIRAETGYMPWSWMLRDLAIHCQAPARGQNRMAGTGSRWTMASGWRFTPDPQRSRSLRDKNEVQQFCEPIPLTVEKPTLVFRKNRGPVSQKRLFAFRFSDAGCDCGCGRRSHAASVLDRRPVLLDHSRRLRARSTLSPEPANVYAR